MDGETLIKLAILKRAAQGLSLKAYGAEGRTEEEPFTCHAKDEAQRDRWAASMRAKGFTVEQLEVK